MSTCARCGHELGVGRFCTNCGHRIGEPVPESEVLPRFDASAYADRPTDLPGGTRARWFPAAVGVVLALVLVVVLVSCLGGDDEPTGPTGKA